MPDRSLIVELFSWFGFLMSSAFGNPLPEEVMIVMGGIRTSQLGEYATWRWLMLPACLLGAFVADLLLYGIGRLFGAFLQRRGWMDRLAPPRKQAQIHDNFTRYGIIIFVIGRLVPGIRTTLFLTAGTLRLPFLMFLLADGLGALIGTSLFFFLGYGLGAQFRDFLQHLEDEITPYKPLLIGGLLVAVVCFVAYRILRRPIPTGDPEEVPFIGHQIATHLPASDSRADLPALSMSGSHALANEPIPSREG